MSYRLLWGVAILWSVSMLDVSWTVAEETTSETVTSDAATSDVTTTETIMASKEKVAFDLFDSGYFVLNTVKPCEGKDQKTGCFETPASFAGTFGIARVMGTGQRFFPDDYFDDHFVAVYIEWGKTPWDYDVRDVRRDGKRLVVKVSKVGEESPTANFAVPLILGFSKAECAGAETVIFDFIPVDSPVDNTGTAVSLDLCPTE